MSKQKDLLQCNVCLFCADNPKTCEAQFESYRALASYIIDAICGDSRNLVNLSAFADKVRDHNQLNFDAFREEISYAALKREFEDGMVAAPVASYTDKVRNFMKSIVR